MEKTAIGEFATWGRERLPDGQPRAGAIALRGTELFAGREIEMPENHIRDKPDFRWRMYRLGGKISGSKLDISDFKTRRRVCWTTVASHLRSIFLSCSPDLLSHSSVEGESECAAGGCTASVAQRADCPS
jgi:hypothetical protein